MLMDLLYFLYELGDFTYLGISLAILIVLMVLERCMKPSESSDNNRTINY
jgi:hypothetical protein